MRRSLLAVPLLGLLGLTGCVAYPATPYGYYGTPSTSVVVAGGGYGGFYGPRPWGYYRPNYGYGYGWRRW